MIILISCALVLSIQHSLALGGCWLFLATFGSSWRVLALLGASERSLAPPGTSCRVMALGQLVGAPGISWRLMAFLDASCRFLGAPGGAWRLLGLSATSWAPMAAPGCSGLLAAPSGSWQLVGWLPGVADWVLWRYQNLAKTSQFAQRCQMDEAIRFLQTSVIFCRILSSRHFFGDIERSMLLTPTP